MVLLETRRLRLRQFTPDDLVRLVELDSDPEVMWYITYGEPSTREEYANDILPRWLRYYRDLPLLGYWAAEDLGSGTFHGWFHLRPDRLDAGEHLLTRAGETVQLPPKVFDTLLALVENSGHILEKDEFIKRLWPDTLVEEGSLTRNISYLRKALGNGECKTARS
jgi:hypothetical protein